MKNLLIFILLLFLLLSCNNNESLDAGKTSLLSYNYICEKETSVLKSKVEKCNNDKLQEKLKLYVCNVFESNKMGNKNDESLFEDCMKNINNMSCEDLNHIDNISEIENCYHINRVENYKTQKKLCIEEYQKFCEILNHACPENLTDECRNAKTLDEREGVEPNSYKFDSDKFDTVCNQSDADEYIKINDLRCAKRNINSCQEFDNINYDIDNFYGNCEE